MFTLVLWMEILEVKKINSEDSNFNKSESCLCFYVEEDRYKTPNICNQL